MFSSCLYGCYLDSLLSFHLPKICMLVDLLLSVNVCVTSHPGCTPASNPSRITASWRWMSGWSLNVIISIHVFSARKQSASCIWNSIPTVTQGLCGQTFIYCDGEFLLLHPACLFTERTICNGNYRSPVSVRLTRSDVHSKCMCESL